MLSEDMYGVGTMPETPMVGTVVQHVRHTNRGRRSAVTPLRESPHVGGEVEAQYSVPQFCNHPMFYYVPGSRFEITTTAI